MPPDRGVLDRRSKWKVAYPPSRCAPVAIGVAPPIACASEWTLGQSVPTGGMRRQDLPFAAQVRLDGIDSGGVAPISHPGIEECEDGRMLRRCRPSWLQNFLIREQRRRTRPFRSCHLRRAGGFAAGRLLLGCVQDFCALPMRRGARSAPRPEAASCICSLGEGSEERKLAISLDE